MTVRHALVLAALALLVVALALKLVGGRTSTGADWLRRAATGSS